MGLCMVLVGHLNFLLAALVHGTVLRHISLNTQTLEYAISNILALAAGLVGILIGVLTIVLSRNENRVLTWGVCMLSAVGGVLAAASVVGLLVALVWTLINGTKGLLLHCNLPDDMSYFSITFECPFDPTRIYGTTLVLWVPLIVMSVVEMVISGRCCAAAVSFIRRKTSMHCETGSIEPLGAAQINVVSVQPCLTQQGQLLDLIMRFGPNSGPFRVLVWKEMKPERNVCAQVVLFVRLH
ncbi:transmembrane protein 54b [Silurus asotus]|uniref:Transmembrane protein 54b n=1 Tax=Silurus asotus TaxID=30991 RepID=A0AAD5AHZ6_SILAS|nr:transmembrane protein 54b [Silurus asotus]